MLYWKSISVKTPVLFLNLAKPCKIQSQHNCIF